MNEDAEREAFYEWEGQNSPTPLEAWLARALLSASKPAVAQDDDDRELLESLAMRLESGRFFNGVAQTNADIYAHALRKALAAASAQSDEQGERKAFEAWWDNAIGLYDRKDLAWHAWLAAKNS